ncbi:adenosine kinase [Acuticoccus sediminis]|uniref:Adenosine kinase n=1 Tax=Acuticoccus sediminis TaxID=2184697 RepID=A0A8B2NU62_9HYPH|nr:adenosine kinase [Acuticoccus sediminis]RAI03737.1 adenosine kinase [Acuticoccus sediminis]
MTDVRFDVLGIGNAIFDILGHVHDDALERLGVAKGSMRLVNEEEARAVDDQLTDSVRVSGGSAGNTVAGVASLGGRAAFIGKVADDANGEAYVHDMRHAGVAFTTPPLIGGAPTATSTILVTPDGERTMNTFLGASQELTEADIVDGLVEAAAITFLEGYLFDPPAAMAAFYLAAKRATAAGKIAAITLSDSFCVERHRDDFMTILSGGTIGLCFANASEVKSLFQTDDFDAAAARLGELVPTAVVTMSEKGARVITGGEAIDVPAGKTKVVDLTGAGDLFAGGYMLGHARGLAPAECARLGALCAAEVISHFGARPQTTLADLAKDAGFTF